jgi:hypothetical protein
VARDDGESAVDLFRQNYGSELMRQGDAAK